MASRDLRRIRAGVELAGSAGYGIDLTDTIADLFNLRVSTFDMVPDTTVIPDPTVNQRIHQARVHQKGFSPVSVSIEAPLCSTGQALTDGVTATKDSVSKVFEAILGGYQAGEGSVVASGASTTGVTVSAADGAQFVPGTIIGVETAVGSDRYVATKVKTRSTDAITFATSVGFTPAVGAKVINGQLLYHAQIAVASTTTLQFLEEHEDRDLIRLALGCYATAFGISWERGADAMWNASLTGADWLEDAAMATPQGGSPLAVATLDGSNPIPVSVGSVVLTPIAGTTRTLPVVDQLTFEFGVAFSPANSYNGVGGIAQAVQTVGARKTVSMKVLADDVTWSTVFSAGTKYQMLAQANNIAGSILAIEVGTMVLDAEPKLEVVNGVKYWNLVWGILEDENCDDGGSEVERAPIRVFRG